MTKSFFETASRAVDDYNEKQKKALETTPAYLSRCFIPINFSACNFTTNIASGHELWKFFDSMHEFRTYYYAHDILNGKFLPGEIEMIENIAINYGEIYNHFDRITNPVGLNQMLSSLPTVRIIESISKKLGRNLNVLEIGGGSGLLGQMLLVKNHTYTNFDTTQSFAIHNIVVNSLLHENDFANFVEVPIETERNSLITSARKINFLPWWHFANTSLNLPRYDVIIMNHCFREISKKAIAMILSRLSSQCDDRVSLIVSEWGSAEYTELEKEVLFNLEKDYDFKLEPINGSPVVNPVGTVLVSFKRIHPFLDDYHNVPINKRVMTHDPWRPVAPKFGFAKKYIPKKLKSVVRAGVKFIFETPRDFELKVLGTRAPQISLNLDCEQNITMNGVVELDRLIKRLEDRFGKPVYTEDEMFGYFINNPDHA
jgi:hypothetical protein